MDLESASGEPLIAPEQRRGDASRSSRLPERSQPAPAFRQDRRGRQADRQQPLSAGETEGYDLEEDGSDTDRWASERDEAQGEAEAESLRHFVPPSSELSDMDAWVNSKDDEPLIGGNGRAGASDSQSKLEDGVPGLAAGAAIAMTSIGTGSERVGPAPRAPGGRTEAHRRPNPWENANKKTFKPIITIGGKASEGAGRSILHRRRTTLGLPFQRQRDDKFLPPSPFPASASDSFDTAAFRCGTSCIGAAIDVKEVYTHYQSEGLQCTACARRAPAAHGQGALRNPLSANRREAASAGRAPLTRRSSPPRARAPPSPPPPPRHRAGTRTGSTWSCTACTTTRTRTPTRTPSTSCARAAGPARARRQPCA